jgi:nucleoside-diphosphate-sugar epimerase
VRVRIDTCNRRPLIKCTLLSLFGRLVCFEKTKTKIAEVVYLMRQVAIRAVGLGKRHAIGERARYHGLRDTIANSIKALARLFGPNRRNGNISRKYLLEATCQHCRDAVFIFISTNKVYGDAPNGKPLVEIETRYDYSDPVDYEAIDEHYRIDQSLHSLFGASKAAADLYAQEYGRYFGMSVGIFRGGCLTGPAHTGVELHGFLSYLVKVALSGKPYSIFGYKGKQVRDNIHSFDVVRVFEEFARNPRPGEVYNLGGGRANSISILEAIKRIEVLTGRKVQWTYSEKERKGDHICYISNLQKLKHHYPDWNVTRSLDSILEEMVIAEREHGQKVGT